MWGTIVAAIVLQIALASVMILPLVAIAAFLQHLLSPRQRGWLVPTLLLAICPQVLVRMLLLPGAFEVFVLDESNRALAALIGLMGALVPLAALGFLSVAGARAAAAVEAGRVGEGEGWGMPWEIEDAPEGPTSSPYQQLADEMAPAREADEEEDEEGAPDAPAVQLKLYLDPWDEALLDPPSGTDLPEGSEPGPSA